MTPYRSQKQCLIEKFKYIMKEAASEVEIMTVDSCQGREMDVIIFSCVRGERKPSSLGFVSDIKRLNVAITRAKHALWILGQFNFCILI